MKPGTRELVFFLVLLALPIAAWYMDFTPRAQAMQTLEKRIRTREAKLADMGKLRATINDIRAELTADSKVIKSFEIRLPQEKEVDEVLKGICQMAMGNRLEAKKIRTIPHKKSQRFTQESGAYGEIPVQLQIQGNFRGLYSFLLAMENETRIMRIRSMTLQRSKKLPEGHVRAVLELSIFFQPKRDKK